MRRLHLVFSAALLVAATAAAPVLAAPQPAYTIINSGDFWAMCRDRELDNRKEQDCTLYLLGQIDAAVVMAKQRGPKLCMDFNDDVPMLIDRVLDHVPSDLSGDREIASAIQAAIVKVLAC